MGSESFQLDNTKWLEFQEMGTHDQRLWLQLGMA